MSSPGDEDELVVVERSHHDPPVGRKLAGEPDVDLLADGEIDDLLGMARADDEADIRMLLGVADEQWRQDVRADRRRGSDAELARASAS
jgi:hypothetical protein